MAGMNEINLIHDCETPSLRLNDASTVYAIVRGLKIAAVECRAAGAICAGPREGKAEKESDGMQSCRGNMRRTLGGKSRKESDGMHIYWDSMCRPLEGEKTGNLLLLYAYTM